MNFYLKDFTEVCTGPCSVQFSKKVNNFDSKILSKVKKDLNNLQKTSCYKSMKLIIQNEKNIDSASLILFLYKVQSAFDQNRNNFIELGLLHYTYDIEELLLSCHLEVGSSIPRVFLMNNELKKNLFILINSINLRFH